MKYKLLYSIAAMAAIASGQARAQEAASGSDTQQQAGDGEIIVTATRESSLLSKTPIALTAISGGDLVKSGISNPTQLDAMTPNLAITRANGLQITIRGVASTDGTEKGDPSAAFMLNGIYIARQQSQEVSFFDIERVEVLRGPQGTLYGRNSTAGVINVLSVRPKQEFGGSLEASYANYNSINATGVLNVPVSSTFALRAAVNVDRRNSFIIDGFPADGVTFNPFKENYSGRLSALWEPSSDLSVYLVADYSKIKGVYDYDVPVDNFYTNIVTGVRPTFETATWLDRSSSAYRTHLNPHAQQSRRDYDDKGITGEINYNLGPVRLTYLGSYREFNRDDVQNVANGFIMSAFKGQFWQTSHELRLALTGNGPLQAQIGAYYFKESSALDYSLYNVPFPPFGPNTAYKFLRDPTIAENKSVFGQATYEIAPKLKLTGGLRYSHDTKSRIGTVSIDTYSGLVNAYNLGTFVSSQLLETTAAKRSWSKVTWRAGIDYDSPLGLVFASVSTGYKAGGFNDGCEIGTGPNCSENAEALYYNPEMLTAYEAGVKFKFSKALRLNGTIFHYDYSGLQLSQTANVCGPGGNLPCARTRNAASAKVDGVELDADLRPSDRLSIRLAFNYLDARYKTFVPEPGVDFAGRSLDLSPKWTWTVGANYRIPVGEGDVTASAQTRFSSRYELTDQGNYAYFYQPAFTKTNLSLTYNAPGNRFYVGGFVNNLEDTVTVTYASAGPLGLLTFADPRQYGVRAGVRF